MGGAGGTTKSSRMNGQMPLPAIFTLRKKPAALIAPGARVTGSGA